MKSFLDIAKEIGVVYTVFGAVAERPEQQSQRGWGLSLRQASQVVVDKWRGTEEEAEGEDEEVTLRG